MIDIENFVFGRISKRLKAKYVGTDGAPAISVYGEAASVPAKFPAVTIVESNNSVARTMRTTSVENAANVMYEVNVYSNVEGYGKAQTKEILKEIDAEFADMGFTRTMANPIANLPDGRIYRMVARYEGVVTAEIGVEDTTYRIYGN